MSLSSSAEHESGIVEKATRQVTRSTFSKWLLRATFIVVGVAGGVTAMYLSKAISHRMILSCYEEMQNGNLDEFHLAEGYVKNGNWEEFKVYRDKNEKGD